MSVLERPKLSLPPTPMHNKHDINNTFVNTQIGSFMICFTVDGEPVKTKGSDGYLSLKPRGHEIETRHFVLLSAEASLPSVKEVVRVINAYFSRSSHYKVAQVHYAPKQH
jgi:hypothetical protein